MSKKSNVKKIIQSQLCCVEYDIKQKNMILELYSDQKLEKYNNIGYNSAEMFQIVDKVDNIITVKSLIDINSLFVESQIIEYAILKLRDGKYFSIYYFDGYHLYYIDKLSIESGFTSLFIYDYLFVIFVDTDLLVSLGNSSLFDSIKQIGEFREKLKNKYNFTINAFKENYNRVTHLSKLNINKVSVLDVLGVKK